MQRSGRGYSCLISAVAIRKAPSSPDNCRSPVWKRAAFAAARAAGKIHVTHSHGLFFQRDRFSSARCTTRASSAFGRSRSWVAHTTLVPPARLRPMALIMACALAVSTLEVGSSVRPVPRADARRRKVLSGRVRP